MAAFCLIAAVCGAGYAFLIPPLQVADEAAHLFRSYGVSRGRCVAGEFSPLPFSVRRLHQTFPPSLEKHRLITAREVWHWNEVELAPDDTRQVRAIATNPYSCVPYVFPAAGVAAATALDLSPLALIFAGRLAALLAYVAAVAAALAIAPRFRAVIAALALMPMSLHQAASFSADSLTIASGLLAASVALSLAGGGGGMVSPGRLALVTVLMALTALCKSNVILVFLVAAIPRCSEQSRQRYLAGIAIVIATAVGSFLLWTWLSADNAAMFAQRRLARGIDAAANARWALEHPASFAAAVAGSIYSHGRSYVQQFIGVLGYGILPLPSWVTWLYGGMLLAAPFVGVPDLDLKWRARAIAGLVALAGVVSTFFGLLLIGGTSDGDFGSSRLRIEGVSGRYFIPFALPALLAIATPARETWARRFGVLVWIVALASNAAALNAIRLHYYTNEQISIDSSIAELEAPGIVPLREGDVIRQGITPRYDDLARIDLDVGTYGDRMDSGDLTVRIADGTGGRSMAYQRVPLSGLRDGSISVRFAPPISSRGVPLQIEIGLEGAAPGTTLGLYSSAGGRDVYGGGGLALNDVTLEGRDLILRAYRNGRSDWEPSNAIPTHPAKE